MNVKLGTVFANDELFEILPIKDKESYLNSSKTDAKQHTQVNFKNKMRSLDDSDDNFLPFFHVINKRAIDPKKASLSKESLRLT